MILWTSFLDVFEEKEAFWQGVFDWGTESVAEERRERGDESTAAGDEDPIAVLKRRYAAGEIDDAEFEARIDALLETPDALAELEAERERA